MKVFIANFGRGNAMWPDCLRDNTIATVDDLEVHPFWEARDRKGYIDYAVKHLKTAQGAIPTKPVASRWYGLTDTIRDTQGDIWIHREKAEVWWTTSLTEPVKIEKVPAYEPKRDGEQVYRISKRCQPWSNQTKSGAKLVWDGLHPKARDFLFTEGTLQQLAEQNADYALALIEGAPLTLWHDQPTWLAKASRAKHGPITMLTSQQNAVWRMVDTVLSTTKYSNGQMAQTKVKDKQLLLSKDELTSYVHELIIAQDRSCALTGLPLQFDGSYDDAEMLCSLDRIDSDGHYERGNLQIVCRFANRWKSDTNDDAFKRLLSAVRAFNP